MRDVGIAQRSDARSRPNGAGLRWAQNDEVDDPEHQGPGRGGGRRERGDGNGSRGARRDRTPHRVLWRRHPVDRPSRATPTPRQSRTAAVGRPRDADHRVHAARRVPGLAAGGAHHHASAPNAAGGRLSLHTARVRSEPGARAAGQATQRVDVQGDQHGRKDDRRRPGEERRREEAGRTEEPWRRHTAGSPSPVPSRHIAEHRQDEQKAGQHDIPGAEPGDRLGAQWMEREGEGGHRRADLDRGRLRLAPIGSERVDEQAPSQRVHRDRRGDVEQEIRQVVAGRVEIPERAVERVGHPRDRHVLAQDALAPRSPQASPPRAPVVGVLEEHARVVPVHEAVPHHGQKRHEGRGSHERGQQGRDESRRGPAGKRSEIIARGSVVRDCGPRSHAPSAGPALSAAPRPPRGSSSHPTTRHAGRRRARGPVRDPESIPG